MSAEDLGTRMQARRAGTCTVCRGAISKGEEIYFRSAEGAKHLECAGEPARLERTNARAAPCSSCGHRVAAGEGRLELVADTPRKPPRWAVRCQDCW